MSTVATPRPYEAMALLERGVPLSLLLDLQMPVGPRSHEILVAEGAPEDKWWERG